MASAGDKILFGAECLEELCFPRNSIFAYYLKVRISIIPPFAPEAPFTSGPGTQVCRGYMPMLPLARFQLPVSIYTLLLMHYLTHANLLRAASNSL